MIFLSIVIVTLVQGGNLKFQCNWLALFGGKSYTPTSIRWFQYVGCKSEIFLQLPL